MFYSPQEVANFFEIVHEPPGRMVAGRSAPLKLVFTPKLGDEIVTFIPLLTQTGPMRVPIRCTPKKVRAIWPVSIRPNSTQFDPIRPN